MISTNLSFSEVGSLSKLMSDYLNQSANLAQFIFDFHHPEGLQHKLDSRHFDDSYRSVLVNSIKKQYEAAGIAVILPNPRRYKPVNSGPYINRRKATITKYIGYVKLEY